VVEGARLGSSHVPSLTGNIPSLNWSVCSARTFLPICFPFGIPWRCHAFSASCRKPVRRGLVKSQKIWRHECSSAGDEPEIDAQPFLVHLYVALHHRSWWCHRYGSTRSRPLCQTYAIARRFTSLFIYCLWVNCFLVCFMSMRARLQRLNPQDHWCA